MKRLPISFDNVDFVRLDLSRHYIVVDCEFTCYLVLNPQGVKPVEGTDICIINVGSWQLNAWSFLTKKDFPNNAGFSACLCWDNSLVSETVLAPRVYESDIDVANSVSSLKGQPVNITGFSMTDGSTLPVSAPDPLPVVAPQPLPVELTSISGGVLPVKPAVPFKNVNSDSVFPMAPLFKILHIGDFFDVDLWQPYIISDVSGSVVSLCVKFVGVVNQTLPDGFARNIYYGSCSEYLLCSHVLYGGSHNNNPIFNATKFWTHYAVNLSLSVDNVIQNIQVVAYAPYSQEIKDLSGTNAGSTHWSWYERNLSVSGFELFYIYV